MGLELRTHLAHRSVSAARLYLVSKPLNWSKSAVRHRTDCWVKIGIPNLRRNGKEAVVG